MSLVKQYIAETKKLRDVRDAMKTSDDPAFKKTEESILLILDDLWCRMDEISRMNARDGV